MRNIVLVGLGGIGFRHFQSILTENLYNFRLQVVDIDEDALKRAEDWEKNNSNELVDVYYNKAFLNMDGVIDIAIIATSSMARKRVFNDIIDNNDINFVIFEKFLFPREQDYFEIKKVLDEKSIKAYVNCPSRLYPGYIQLKKELAGSKKVDAILTGSNWGMACNAIHTIDVMGYLTDSYDRLTADVSMVDREVLESKRQGYVEFTGRMICEIGDKTRIIFDSYKEGDILFKLTILTDEKVYIIDETSQKMVISRSGYSEELPFPVYYQSQLTAKIVDDLIMNNKCDLTRYENTMQWHIVLLEAYLKIYNQLQGDFYTDMCPIT